MHALRSRQRSDVRQLDRRRLFRGDAPGGDEVAALLQGHLERMVSSDPPWNTKIEHGVFAMASGEGTEEKFTWFLTQALCDLPDA